MADLIEDLKHRRSDMSQVLVHFTKGDPASARRDLLSILGQLQIRSGMAWGIARDFDWATQHIPSVTQRVVCFTDMPLEHCWMMVRDITGRAWDFQPYGIVFGKHYARTRGCHEVLYIDNTDPDSLGAAAMRIVDAYRIAQKADPAAYPLETLDILRMTPFIEFRTPSLDFSWEREWRSRGSFDFEAPANVVAVFAPALDHPAMRGAIAALDPLWAARKVPLLDPKWGISQIVLAMSTTA